MRKSRFSEEQVIGILKEHQAGMPVSDLCRKHGISGNRPVTAALSDTVVAPSFAGGGSVDRDEEYVRRRRWSADEKRAIVDEAVASGNVIGTAKRHGIQAQQIYRWRERLFGSTEPAGFVAVSVLADPPAALPAPMPEQGRPDDTPAPVTDGMTDRIEIIAVAGVTVRLPLGSSAALIVAIASGLARRR